MRAEGCKLFFTYFDGSGMESRLPRIALKSERREEADPVKDYMIERIYAIAEYILETGATVRVCAAQFRVSKTTVHKDMRERLKKINPEKARQVSRVLDGNREERHIRGGMATKEKYLQRGENRDLTV